MAHSRFFSNAHVSQGMLHLQQLESVTTITSLRYVNMCDDAIWERVVIFSNA